MYLNTFIKSSSIAVCIALTACGSDKEEVIEKIEEVLEEEVLEEVIAITNPFQGKVHGPHAIGTDDMSEFVYLDLDTLNILDISDAPEENSQWDVAFKGSEIRLNQHVDNVVSVYPIGNNSDFFDDNGDPIKESFINTTAKLELDDYLAITTEQAPSEIAGYISDKTVNILEGFYHYDTITQIYTPADEKYFIVNSDNHFTKFRVTDITAQGSYISSVSLEIAHQGHSYIRFHPEITLTVDTALSCSADVTDVYIDFNKEEEVDSDDDWDIRLPCNSTELAAEFAMHLADDGQAFHDLNNEYIAIDPSEIESYGFKADEYVIVAFDSLSWFQFNLNDEDLLWSQFDIYLLKTATLTYKFQITDFYDSAGNPGNISFRVDELADQVGIIDIIH